MACLRFLLAVGVLAMAPAFAFAAQGVLEIPAPESNQSGIGVISGWQCSGQRIEISIDGGPPILAGSHTPRDDAAGICGRTDTGFSMLFNWNILRQTECCEIGGIRNHRVVAYADGVPFAESSFYTTKFGYLNEYMTGRSATYQLRNFPDPGTSTQISWDQDKQNFSIVRYNPSGFDQNKLGGSGTYYGIVRAAASSGQVTVRHAKFIVTTENGQAQVRVEYADGNLCQLPAVAVDSTLPVVDGNVKARFDQNATASCADFAGKVVNITANGRVLDGSSVSGIGPVIVAVTIPSFP